MSTAVAKSDIRGTLERFGPSYAKLLPKNYPVDRLITGALLSLQENPTLGRCEPRSVAIALARVAQLGLDVGDTAHLVPYGSKCTMVVDYKGMIRLLKMAGARKVEAHEVRQGDDFTYSYGLTPTLDHRPSTNRSSPITHVYAVVWLSNGETQFEVMTAAEIDEIRQQHSKAWKAGPLPAWYGRKTVLKRLAKYVEKSPRLAAALQVDEFDPETGEVLGDLPVIEAGDAAEPEAVSA